MQREDRKKERAEGFSGAQALRQVSDGVVETEANLLMYLRRPGLRAGSILFRFRTGLLEPEAADAAVVEDKAGIVARPQSQCRADQGASKRAVRHGHDRMALRQMA